jgi:uncharacterized coiled-coil DUF342 family protein
LCKIGDLPMSKVDELKQIINIDKYVDKLKSRRDELEKELNDVKDSLGEYVDDVQEYVDEATVWVKSNSVLIGIVAGALVIGFALGASLV